MRGFPPEETTWKNIEDLANKVLIDGEGDDTTTATDQTTIIQGLEPRVQSSRLPKVDQSKAL